MLSPKLREIKEKIETKTSYRRTDGENELLKELEFLEGLFERHGLSELRESVKSYTQITSGPASSCPCCGK